MANAPIDSGSAQEQSRRETEEIYRFTFEHAAVGLSHVAPDGRFLRLNQRFCDIVGYPPDEILKLRYQDITHPEDLDTDVAQATRVAEGSSPAYSMEKRYIRKDGSTVWVNLTVSSIRNADGTLKHFISAVDDITARKEAEQMHSRLAAIVESSNDAIVSKDLDGTITTWNEAAQRMFGFTRAEAVGRPITLILPADRREEEQRLRERLRSGERIQHYQTVRMAKSGNLLDVSLTMSPVKDAQGRIVGMSSIARDVTYYKRLEAQVMESRKMEAVAYLAGGVAHEFNNIMMIIHGTAELMEDKLHKEDPLRKSIATIQNAAERATRLTSQLLAFSRKQMIQPQAFDLNELIARKAGMLKHSLGTGIQFVLRSGEGLRQVQADPHQMELVLSGLIANAREAMPAGGRLVIETANIDIDQDHPAIQPGGYVMIAVSDTGIGMDDKVKSHIFEPFFTTKGRATATGLSLAGIYGTIHQSGGVITVESELGKGTTFRIYLPEMECVASNVAIAG